MVLLALVIDVGVDQQRIGLCVNVFHHDLESVEASGFWPANFSVEIFNQVLVDNTVAGCKEGEDVLDEMLLVLVEVFPVFEVLCKIDFFSGPERGLCLLVGGPNIVVFNWEKNEPVQVFLKHRLDVFL